MRDRSRKVGLFWVASLVGLLLTLNVAAAHDPGTTGIPKRGCEPVMHDRYYVGVSGKVGCSRARGIARAQIRSGRVYKLWRCTGRGTGFGHCHGLARWRGSTVHWAVND